MQKEQGTQIEARTAVDWAQNINNNIIDSRVDWLSAPKT